MIGKMVYNLGRWEVSLQEQVIVVLDGNATKRYVAVVM